jgi:hypothetical protein
MGSGCSGALALASCDRATNGKALWPHRNPNSVLSRSGRKGRKGSESTNQPVRREGRPKLLLRLRLRPQPTLPAPPRPAYLKWIQRAPGQSHKQHWSISVSGGVNCSGRPPTSPPPPAHWRRRQRGWGWARRFSREDSAAAGQTDW